MTDAEFFKHMVDIGMAPDVESAKDLHEFIMSLEYKPNPYLEMIKKDIEK